LFLVGNYFSFLSETAGEDVFGRIDRNNSGRITKREFDDVLVDMNLDASREQLDEAMRRYDVDGDGSIDWREFQKAVWDGPSSFTGGRGRGDGGGGGGGGGGR